MKLEDALYKRRVPRSLYNNDTQRNIRCVVYIRGSGKFFMRGRFPMGTRVPGIIEEFTKHEKKARICNFIFAKLYACMLKRLCIIVVIVRLCAHAQSGKTGRAHAQSGKKRDEIETNR